MPVAPETCTEYLERTLYCMGHSGMVTSQELIRELPRLRRFSRALCGVQKEGDATVALALRSIFENPGLISESQELTLSLFRAYCQNWEHKFSKRLGDRGQDRSSEERGVDQSIALITPRPRQAFLLSALEGFSVADVAFILDTSADEVVDLIEQTRRQIVQQTSTSVLIVEDEVIVAAGIRTIVEEMGHTVVGIARTHAQAMLKFQDSQLRTKRLGLILADVQLADGSSGIEAVGEILRQTLVPVIFITAFPQRLLTGRALEPTFLLNKPFDVGALRAMITQVLFFRSHSVEA